MGAGRTAARRLGAGMALGLAAVAWASAAVAQDKAPAPPDSAARQPLCTRVSWRVRPTAGDLYAVWPREAMLKGEGGRAQIACRVSIQGALHDCTVLSEQPPNSGFGQAAVAVTPQILMNPERCDGEPRESEVHIPIQFVTGGPPPQKGSPRLAEPPTDGSSSLPRAATAAEVVLPQVQWIEAPTYAQVVAAYPAKARAATVGGHVALVCRFGGDGRLDHCDTFSENPRGLGFAPAAHALAKAFVGPAKLPDGSSTRGDITTVAFTFDPAMLSAAAPVIGEPKWRQTPQAEAVAAHFPAAARAAHVGVGHVMMACDVGAGGRLTGCTVTRATPEGLGFEAAALALSANFQVTVWTDEGLPTVGGRIDVPIRYELGGAAAYRAAAMPPLPVAPARQAAPIPGSAASASAAPAATVPPGRPVVFQAFTLFTHFSAGPYYPERAARLGITGAADLDCVLGEAGFLNACEVVAEAPADQGFGDAAERMAKKRAIRLKDALAVDAPGIGARIRVLVPFQIEGAR